VVPKAELLPGTLDLLILKAETERWNRTALAVNTALRAQEA
jgi:hypothetical protein